MIIKINQNGNYIRLHPEGLKDNETIESIKRILYQNPVYQNRLLVEEDKKGIMIKPTGSSVHFFKIKDDSLQLLSGGAEIHIPFS